MISGGACRDAQAAAQRQEEERTARRQVRVHTHRMGVQEACPSASVRASPCCPCFFRLLPCALRAPTSRTRRHLLRTTTLTIRGPAAAMPQALPKEGQVSDQLAPTACQACTPCHVPVSLLPRLSSPLPHAPLPAPSLPPPLPRAGRVPFTYDRARLLAEFERVTAKRAADGSSHLIRLLGGNPAALKRALKAQGLRWKSLTSGQVSRGGMNGARVDGP